MTQPQRNASRQGFTLVELLVVMAIIVVLMGITIGVAGAVNRGAAEAKAKAQIADLMNHLELYKADKGSYPATLGTLVSWWETEKYQGTKFNITEVSGTAPNFTLIDPWGQAYIYSYNAANPFVYLIGSRGPDGRYGSKDNPNTLDHFGKGDDITNRNGTL